MNSIEFLCFTECVHRQTILEKTMRTQEQFATIWHQLEWWHSFHKKAVWLVALEDRYALSVIKPRADEIAKGTVANLYDVGGEILDSVSNP